MTSPAAAKPVPEISEVMRPFFDAAHARRLVVQRCEGCGLLRFPAREQCHRCLSRQSTWTEVAGRGTVFSFGIVHQVHHPGFAAEVPYAVVVVELDEGVRMTSNLIDCPPDAIRIGMPVEVVFEAVTPEITLPKFRRR